MLRASDWRKDLGSQGLGLGFPDVSCGEFFPLDVHSLPRAKQGYSHLGNISCLPVYSLFFGIQVIVVLVCMELNDLLILEPMSVSVRTSAQGVAIAAASKA